MYGKSASAGAASMTPSSVAVVCAVIEVMRVKTVRRRATHRNARNRRPGETARRSSTQDEKVPVALLRPIFSSAMSKVRTVLQRTTSFSVEAGEAAGGARPAAVLSKGKEPPPNGGGGMR